MQSHEGSTSFFIYMESGMALDPGKVGLDPVALDPGRADGDQIVIA